AKLAKISPARLYTVAPELGIRSNQMAQAIAQFLQLTYVPRINPEDIRLGVLQPPFCKAHQVIPTRDAEAANAFVLANPFNWDLLDILKKLSGSGPRSALIITEPENIAAVLFGGSAEGEKSSSATDLNADFNLMSN